jgi:hypothetical protein
MFFEETAKDFHGRFRESVGNSMILINHSEGSIC